MLDYANGDKREKSPRRLLMGACALLGTGPVPSDEVSARALGRAETLAYVHDDAIDLWELASLEAALSEHIYKHGGKTSFHVLDFDRLVGLVKDSQLVSIALHRLGYFAQPRNGQIIWSNKPDDGNLYRLAVISFAGVNAFVADRGFVTDRPGADHR